ncbi:site-specific DNA-methyltransferase [Candidatus Poribacteria bacterium]|nr:site-specific DNA-methyltransferase [Candidatus Poribacteria bacterium]MYA55380.1 site-specific DNA-methyltransferase [Candidatus Poribacteria bacterium]
MSETIAEHTTNNVFSTNRIIEAPVVPVDFPDYLKPNTRLKMDGLEFLSHFVGEFIPVAFLDPQYRGVLDKMNYGNEGKSREKRRCALQQMSEELIVKFIRGIDIALMPSGHLFLWIDKFHLCQGFTHWIEGTQLEVVDMIVWDKESFGMGYRSRRTCEYCVVLQKLPKRAKGVWQVHNIRDVWREPKENKKHPHQKPVKLQAALITAVSNEGDYIIDPAAGSFSVMESAHLCNRKFIGCDLEG